jgi:flagellar biosynthetic protein FlhB
MSQERTESATPKRLQMLGARGTTARSTDLTNALALLAAVVGLQQVAAYATGHSIAAIQTTFLHVDRPDLTPTDLPGLVQPLGTIAITVFGGVVAPVALVALAAGLFQIRGRLAFRAIQPTPSRLSPLGGLKRMFSLESVVSLVIPMAKLAVVAVAIQGPARAALQTLPTALAGGVGAQFQALSSTIMDAARNGATALVLLAVADVIYRRWQFTRQARMTKQELREESRETEGDPAIRGRMRALRRQLARRRMLHKVATAQLVIVNPTHFAVALAYESKKMAAPEVVAKGTDLIAERIIGIAREHQVPVVARPPLARALYHSVEIGEPIPVALYQAIAEVLAYVYNLRQRR